MVKKRVGYKCFVWFGLPIVRKMIVKHLFRCLFRYFDLSSEGISNGRKQKNLEIQKGSEY